MKQSQSKPKQSNKEWIIDADVVIEKFNKENPELRQMTQKSLAEQLGVTPQLLSDWRRGRIIKTVQTLKHLAEIGGCSIEDFIKPKNTN